jgi:hypothetical protein
VERKRQRLWRHFVREKRMWAGWAPLQGTSCPAPASDLACGSRAPIRVRPRRHAEPPMLLCFIQPNLPWDQPTRLHHSRGAPLRKCAGGAGRTSPRASEKWRCVSPNGGTERKEEESCSLGEPVAWMGACGLNALGGTTGLDWSGQWRCNGDGREARKESGWGIHKGHARQEDE